MKYNIGFMQGRLSPMQGKKIQSFPWKNWKNEFEIGKGLNFKIMEWRNVLSWGIIRGVMCSVHNIKTYSTTVCFSY